MISANRTIRQLLRAGLQERGLLRLAQDPRPAVIDLQPLHRPHGLREHLAPFDGLGEDAPQRIELPVHRPRPDRLRRARVLMAAPLPRQPFALELLDSVGRDLVQDERPERAIKDLDDLPIPCDAALVLFGVVGQIGVRKGLERDVWLLANALPTLENPDPLCRFELLRLLLVRRFRRVAIPTAVDAEVVEPVMLALRRGQASERMPVLERWSAEFTEAHNAPPVLRILARCCSAQTTASARTVNRQALSITPFWKICVSTPCGLKVAEFHAIDILSAFEHHQQFARIRLPWRRLWRPVQQCPCVCLAFVLAIIAHL